MVAKLHLSWRVVVLNVLVKFMHLVDATLYCTTVKGKKTARELWIGCPEAFPEVTNAIASLSFTLGQIGDGIVAQLERIVILVYVESGTKKTVNEPRKTLF